MLVDRVGEIWDATSGRPLRGGRSTNATHAKVASVRRARRGAAVVETAIVISLFFFFVLVTVEMGRMGMANHVITHASREGARVAVIPGNTAATVTSTVQNLMNSGGITAYTLTMTPSDPSTTHLGDQVTVQVSTSFSNISWLSNPLFLGSVTLSASSTLSSEWP
jgi:Flp pilus assembly protein TadG